jgi:hypothetical protein
MNLSMDTKEKIIRCTPEYHVIELAYLSDARRIYIKIGGGWISIEEYFPYKGNVGWSDKIVFITELTMLGHVRMNDPEIILHGKANGTLLEKAKWFIDK